MRPLVFVVFVHAACGRVGFDERSDDALGPWSAPRAVPAAAGAGDQDIWMATRSAPGAPTRVTFASIAGEEDEDPWMSPDRRLFVFARGADKDVYELTR